MSERKSINHDEAGLKTLRNDLTDWPNQQTAADRILVHSPLATWYFAECHETSKADDGPSTFNQNSEVSDHR